MSFLDRINENNVWHPEHFRHWVVDGCRVGRIRHDLVPQLRKLGDTFVIEDDAVHLHPRFTTFSSRSAAMDDVLRRLEEDGIVKGRRSAAQAAQAAAAATRRDAGCRARTRSSTPWRP